MHLQKASHVEKAGSRTFYSGLQFALVKQVRLSILSNSSYSQIVYTLHRPTMQSTKTLSWWFVGKTSLSPMKSSSSFNILSFLKSRSDLLQYLHRELIRGGRFLPLDLDHGPFGVLRVPSFWDNPDKLSDDRRLVCLPEQKGVSDLINSLFEAYLFVLLLPRSTLGPSGTWHANFS